MEGEGDDGATNHGLPDVPEWPENERLNHEKELVGHYLSGHPLDKHAEQLAGVDFTATTDLDHLAANTKVELLGLVRAIRAITTKRGDRMAFVTVEEPKILRGGSLANRSRWLRVPDWARFSGREGPRA